MSEREKVNIPAADRSIQAIMSSPGMPNVSRTTKCTCITKVSYRMGRAKRSMKIQLLKRKEKKIENMEMSSTLLQGKNTINNLLFLVCSPKFLFSISFLVNGKLKL